MQIQHQDNQQQGEFFICDETGQKIAYLTYQYLRSDCINADRTFVDECLRGQGVAHQLFLALMDFVQQKQLTLRTSCAYIEQKVRSKI
ncbi:GNAT family N-acetyltransferase [Volucribacter amazonae]|uniref:Acetyltransferase n=1 Tax=Volucribacter amazonae TaxID=256731 RepID=A0A9X4SL73_9PAST|nr:GNAT family N-acetyltransferase [Volucribacter amazonae]MDG6895859.1 acetyltransferase [Volucribacter amazonae]